MHFSPRNRKRRWMWGGLLVAIAAILALAFAPPFLPPAGRSFVMHLFAPVCHQMTVRSPHIGEIQIAICDRCTGIYVGLAIGVLLVPLFWTWRRTVQRRAVPLLLGGLAVVGIDWIGPILGVWSNVPLSRGLTGALLGLVAGLLAGMGVLRSGSSPKSSAGAGASSS